MTPSNQLKLATEQHTGENTVEYTIAIAGIFTVKMKSEMLAEKVASVWSKKYDTEVIGCSVFASPISVNRATTVNY